MAWVNPRVSEKRGEFAGMFIILQAAGRSPRSQNPAPKASATTKTADNTAIFGRRMHAKRCMMGRVLARKRYRQRNREIYKKISYRGILFCALDG
jgi:hypothetical protein